MLKYLVKRIVYGMVCIVLVVAIVMVMIYTLLDKKQVFAADGNYGKNQSNQKITYMHTKWEEYGYLDYVTYSDYLNDEVNAGRLSQETRDAVAAIGRTADEDSPETAEYVKKFTEEYHAKGYKVLRYDAEFKGRKLAKGGQQILFATKDRPILERVWEYFTGIITIDNINYVEEDIGPRGISFTWKDPLYGGEKFSPAIIGNGTQHKYLLYFDDQFPFIHQNVATITLGTSYSVNMGVDVFKTMTRSQGSYVASPITYPTGLSEDSADNLHSATYQANSREGNVINAARFEDDYTSVETYRGGMSKMGYSFVIGIISSIIAYLLAVPLGILMALKKDQMVDKICNIYIIFIIAVPSLAYIFLFKAIGGKMGLPTTFDMESTSKLMFALPIISMALPSVANIMKWIRRYMIDQMNSDYVKFARSGGLTEGEIFSKHILKNAVIPIVHGIPGTFLFAMTGAIITERVYVVPGAGNLLTEAINKYDNGVIVGVTLFYAILSVTSVILGDVLMAAVDPRISFVSKDR